MAGRHGVGGLTAAVLGVVTFSLLLRLSRLGDGRGRQHNAEESHCRQDEGKHALPDCGANPPRHGLQHVASSPRHAAGVDAVAVADCNVLAALGSARTHQQGATPRTRPAKSTRCSTAPPRPACLRIRQRVARGGRGRMLRCRRVAAVRLTSDRGSRAGSAQKSTNVGLTRQPAVARNSAAKHQTDPAVNAAGRAKQAARSGPTVQHTPRGTRREGHSAWRFRSQPYVRSRHSARAHAMRGARQHAEARG